MTCLGPCHLEGVSIRYVWRWADVWWKVRLDRQVGPHLTVPQEHERLRLMEAMQQGPGGQRAPWAHSHFRGPGRPIPGCDTGDLSAGELNVDWLRVEL